MPEEKKAEEEVKEEAECEETDEEAMVLHIGPIPSLDNSISGDFLDD